MEEIPRYKFGSYHDKISEFDWFIIDTQTDEIVENLSNIDLSEIRDRCREWNKKKFKK